MNELDQFKERFINELSISYPEKAVFLMGMEFDIMLLIEYTKKTKATPESFVSLDFKKYVESSSFYQYTATMSPAANAALGSIFFDKSTSSLKVFDGTKWIQIVH